MKDCPLFESLVLPATPDAESDMAAWRARQHELRCASCRCRAEVLRSHLATFRIQPDLDALPALALPARQAAGPGLEERAGLLWRKIRDFAPEAATGVALTFLAVGLLVVVGWGVNLPPPLAPDECSDVAAVIQIPVFMMLGPLACTLATLAQVMPLLALRHWRSEEPCFA